ncbi:hypothetical protein QTP86_009735 [Hemibagrus guttatus]|nr:hypothetical protein QTP86_009735 [Hemibagrus guttatus]
MKVSRSKTEYMCVNEREGSGTVRLQGEEVKKIQEFKYLGSTVQSNEECGKERLLYGEEIAWADTAYALLLRVEDLNLKVLNLREMDLSATTLFYQSVLRAWSSVLRISRINALPFPCTEEEPLFHNPLIQSRMISSPYIQQRFRRAGITRVKDLMSGNSRKTARELCAETEALSARLMQRLLGEVASALPSCFREALGQDPGRSHQPPPPLSISAAAGEYQWEKAALLSFQMPILTTLEDASKKALYETCVKVSYRGSLAGLKESHWSELLVPDSSP